MKVHIQEPCTENWNEMTPQEQGRHCAKCDKVVVDFSKMDDYSILSHFEANDNTCGRFQHWQLEKELTLPTLHNPWTRWIKNAALGSFLFGGTLPAKAQTFDALDTQASKTEIVPIDSNSQNSRMVSGYIQQPDDTTKRLHTIHFRIDSFDMILPVDTSKISFILPNAISSDTMQLELQSDSSSTLLNLELNASDTTTFTLVYNNQWEFLNVDSFHLDWTADTTDQNLFEISTIVTQIYGGFTTGVTTMEPPNPDITFDPWIDNKAGNKAVPIQVNNISGLELTRHKHLNEQKLRQTNKASKNLVVYNKRKSSVWWWLLPIPLLLFFAGYYWKKKQAMLEV